jgi:hypothetical protein
MERPTPIRIMRANRDQTLNAISMQLRQQGFLETARDIDRGEIRASRSDPDKAGARDDVLVWIDGQAGEPGRIRIYVDQGRYERVLGQPEARRLKQDADQVRQRFGAIRDAINTMPEAGA